MKIKEKNRREDKENVTHLTPIKLKIYGLLFENWSIHPITTRKHTLE